MGSSLLRRSLTVLGVYNFAEFIYDNGFDFLIARIEYKYLPIFMRQ